jgi:hypothetical protein
VAVTAAGWQWQWQWHLTHALQKTKKKHNIHI